MRKINKLSNAIRVADATELSGKISHEIQGAAIEDTICQVLEPKLNQHIKRWRALWIKSMSIRH